MFFKVSAVALRISLILEFLVGIFIPLSFVVIYLKSLVSV